MIRGYDSSKILRDGITERMKYLRNEIGASERLMERLKVEAADSEKRIQKLKKELGITDPAEPFIWLNITNSTRPYQLSDLISVGSSYSR